MKRISAIIMLLLVTIIFVSPFAFATENDDPKEEIECISENNSIVVVELEKYNFEPQEINDIEIENEVDEVEVAISDMQKEVDVIDSIEDRMEWFIAYKEIIDKYSYILDPPETIYDIYSQEEIYIMQRCVETEVYGADFESKVNVANVILNRIEHEAFPDNPIDVITAVNQFAYGREKITESTILALEYAFMMPDTTEGAIFFHSNNFSPTFNGAEWIFTDEVGHHFYR